MGVNNNKKKKEEEEEEEDEEILNLKESNLCPNMEEGKDTGR